MVSNSQKVQSSAQGDCSKSQWACPEVAAWEARSWGSELSHQSGEGLPSACSLVLTAQSQWHLEQHLRELSMPDSRILLFLKMQKINHDFSTTVREHFLSVCANYAMPFFYSGHSTSASLAPKLWLSLQFCIYYYVLCLATIPAQSRLRRGTAHNSHECALKPLSAMENITTTVIAILCKVHVAKITVSIFQIYCDSLMELELHARLSVTPCAMPAVTS